MMQIQNLEAFLALAKNSSISSCADQLNISQQGLSRQLKVMEDELGTKLFSRTHQGIELTTAGKAVLPDFQQVVEDYAVSLQKIAKFQQIRKEEILKIYVCPGIKQALGLDFFYQFQENHQKLKLNLQFGEDDVCEQALLTGKADAAFLDWPHHPEAFTSHLVVRSRLVAVMRSDNSLASLDEISMRQLAGVQVYFPDESNYMSQRFRKHWPKFYNAVKTPFSSNDYDTFYRLPQRLGGVALTFKFLCQHLEKGLVALPVRETSYVQIYFCRRRETIPTPGLNLLTHYITSHVHLIER